MRRNPVLWLALGMAAVPAAAADLILTGARVWTGDDGRPGRGGGRGRRDLALLARPFAAWTFMHVMLICWIMRFRSSEPQRWEGEHP